MAARATGRVPAPPRQRPGILRWPARHPVVATVAVATIAALATSLGLWLALAPEALDHGPAAVTTATAASSAPAHPQDVAGSETADPTGTASSATPTAPGQQVALPTPNAAWDYQIGGAYPPPAGVTMVTRDRADAPVPGLYNVCYVNAFQTQPQETTSWPPSLLLRDAAGKAIGDPDWPGEYLLDTRTAAQRRAIADVLAGWITGCAQRGFQAVEPDNLDSWTRSRGLLTATHNAELARLIVTRAHELGLAVAQKNAVELAAQGRTWIGFDFVVAEDCQQYDECGPYTTAYGPLVFELEFSDAGQAFDTACRIRGSSLSITFRDRNVARPGTAGYAFRTC